MPLTETTTLDAFLRAPFGRYFALPRVILWAASPSLCGGIAWDSPSEDEAKVVTQVFDHYEMMGPSFSMVIDARRMSGFAPGALTALFGWLAAHGKPLSKKLRLQANLIEQGPVGFIAAGMLNSIQGSHPMRVFTDAHEAYRATGGEDGVRLVSELDELVGRVRGVPPELLALRTRLANDVDASLERVASDIGVSIRSLQRVLARHGSSFKDEVTTARFTLAAQLLESTDDKLALVAARVGISERALTSLFRSRTSLAPAEWRRSRAALRNSSEE